MKKTGVKCPQCKQYTDQSPCENCNFEFEDLEAEEMEICPHCDIPLVLKMIDIDGTNLQEHEVCESCGYGYPLKI